jgi:hypothetical protein
MVRAAFILFFLLFFLLFFQFTFLSRGTSIRQSSLPPTWPNLQIDSFSTIPGRRERSGFLEDLWAGDVTFPLILGIVFVHPDYWATWLEGPEFVRYLTPSASSNAILKHPQNHRTYAQQHTKHERQHHRTATSESTGPASPS